jgi:histidinol-phosphate aminotransferase
VFRARIGANESVFGPSPKAIAAMQLAAVNGGYIAIPRTTISKRRFAQKLGLSTANIVVGEGIDSLFGYTVRLFAQRGVAARGAARRRSRQQMSR